MTLSARVSSIVLTRQFGRKYFKILADFEPFPGGLVTMTRTFRNAKRPIEKYEDYLDAILVDRLMCEVTQNGLTHPTKTGEYYKPTREELEWLQEINHLIQWAQSNLYVLDIGKMPEQEFEKGVRCTEADFQIAELSVSAI